MKKPLLLIGLIWIFLGMAAQEYPSEWTKYMSEDYIYDVQTDTNLNNTSETDFKNYLLNTARTNLAKQIEISVRDTADLQKNSVNGKTIVNYTSHTQFSTQLNLKLVETKSLYISSNRTGYAIAYINRNNAINYYTNNLTLLHSKITNSIDLANNYINSGFKTKAQSELESALDFFSSTDEFLFWLNIFGVPQITLNDWLSKFNFAEQNVKQKITDLKHSTIIYIDCKADIFGNSYPTLQNDIKGKLSAIDCSFTDNPQNADWIISIRCSSRKYSNVNFENSKAFFSYVDAQISIDKVITSQRIYENELSIKGAHTFGYSEAAKAGYKEVSKQISEIITNNINQ